MIIQEINITDSREAKWQVVVSSDARYHTPGQNIMEGPRRWTARFTRPDIVGLEIEVGLEPGEMPKAGELQELLEQQPEWKYEVWATNPRWMSR